MKRSCVVVEAINDEAGEIMLILKVWCGDTQISCIAAKSPVEPLEACRPHEGLKSVAPKHPEVPGRATRHAPHKEAFIPDVKSWVSRAGWQGYKSTRNIRRSRIRGAQLGWQGRIQTEVLQDLGI
jgi:hypothetical protein